MQLVDWQCHRYRVGFRVERRLRAQVSNELAIGPIVCNEPRENPIVWNRGTIRIDRQVDSYRWDVSHVPRSDRNMPASDRYTQLQVKWRTGRGGVSATEASTLHI